MQIEPNLKTTENQIADNYSNIMKAQSVGPAKGNLM